MEAQQQHQATKADDKRTCTCHPDDNPPSPCPRRFALNECRAAELAAQDAVVDYVEDVARRRLVRTTDGLDGPV